MKLLTIVAIFTALLTSSHAVEKPGTQEQGSPKGRPAGPLKPGEYWWNQQLSPNGPVVVLVSIPLQVMYVYRNGVLIGRSTVNTGSSDHDTPGGVITVIEKPKPSRKNGEAPVPEMRRSFVWHCTPTQRHFSYCLSKNNIIVDKYSVLTKASSLLIMNYKNKKYTLPKKVQQAKLLH